MANAHVQSIMGSPVITGTNPGRICEFYEKLVTNIQTLESMGKEKEIRGYVRLTLDKLPGIRADLVRLDDEWQDWGFPQLVEALRKWCERNPVPVDSHKDGKFGRHDRGGDRSFQTKQEDWKPKACVYCKSSEHKSVDCEKIKGVADRRKYLSANKLCFNCTGTKHRAAECLCKFFCQKCNGKHHTSICDKISNQLMLATGEGLVVYPVVVVKVEGVMCRALLDTGAGSSYASATLIERLNRQPDHKVYKKIEMMMSSTSQKIEMYKVEISNIKGDFSLPTTLSKVDKGVLLTVPNPQYTEVISQHQHLNGVSKLNTDQFQEDQLKLNLHKNGDGLYECRGRIQGSYPVYLPPDAVLTEKMVHDAHVLSLHGGVGLTMTFIRQEYWVPRLRRLTKKVIRACYGCKKFQVTSFANPPTASLPTDRTVGSVPFEVVGVDFAGPITYKLSPKKEGKAYILLFACSLTRAIHLELLPNQTAEEFIRSLKKFIARKGRPRKIYSDNGRSFTAAATWLSKVMKAEQLQNHLAHQGIQRQFNLSRAPWWGGQFERLVGLVKRALYKGIGRACLFWNELEEVLLDVEVTLNNRPLCYVEDDVQLPVLTPSAMMFGQPKLIPDEHLDEEDLDLRKRVRYLRRCKDVLWSRWTGEYLKSLRERHNLKYKTKEMTVELGDVVLIQSPERNRGKWNIGIVNKLIKGRDGVVRAIRLRAGKSYLERAIQHLYPMELSCDQQREEQEERGEASQMNP